jgi:hypothetical protein
MKPKCFFALIFGLTICLNGTAAQAQLCPDVRNNCVGTLNEGSCPNQNFSVTQLGTLQPNTDYTITICNNTSTPGNIAVMIVEAVGFRVINVLYPQLAPCPFLEVREAGNGGQACADVGHNSCSRTFTIRTNSTLPPGGIVMGVRGMQNFGTPPSPPNPVNYVFCTQVAYLYP